jgi:hypothetical protein
MPKSINVEALRGSSKVEAMLAGEIAPKGNPARAARRRVKQAVSDIEQAQVDPKINISLLAIRRMAGAAAIARDVDKELSGQ